MRKLAIAILAAGAALLTTSTPAFAAIRHSTHHHRAYCVHSHVVKGHLVHRKNGRTYYVPAHNVRGHCVPAR